MTGTRTRWTLAPMFSAVIHGGTVEIVMAFCMAGSANATGP
jgi:hypothetical protein